MDGPVFSFSSGVQGMCRAALVLHLAEEKEGSKETSDNHLDGGVSG